MTKAEYLALRESRVDKEFAVMTALGADGYRILDELFASREAEFDAWRDLPHDDRMEVITADRRHVEELLAKKSE